MLRTIASPRLLGALFVFASASLLSAQLTAQKVITLTAQAPETISISLNAGGTVNFSIPSVGSTSAGSAIPTWVTSWSLALGRTSVKVYAYFASPTALVGNILPNVITAADFTGSANGGAQTAFGGVTIPGTASTVGMVVSTTAISSANLTFSKIDSLALTLTNPVAVPIPTDTYTGSLFILAAATP